MKKKMILMIVLLVIIVLGTLLGFEIHRSNDTLTVSHYTVSDVKITKDIRMVVLADLHNHEFGKENEELLQLVQEQNPDIICCVGDFVVDKKEDIEASKELIEKLVNIAPVYFSMGNHEVHHQMQFPVDFESIFESVGANVLEYEFEDITVNGQELRIGGIYGYCVPENDPENVRYNFKNTDFLKEFMNTEKFTLLLNHLPYTWLELNGLEEWDIDLVYAGHTHGGQIKIPKLGALHAPVQGWFPGKVDGEFKSQDGSRTMIATRGLGSSIIVPRINNVPEVVVVDLANNR